jgi:hypothetical protein
MNVAQDSVAAPAGKCVLDNPVARRVEIADDARYPEHVARGEVCGAHT